MDYYKVLKFETNLDYFVTNKQTTNSEVYKLCFTGVLTAMRKAMKILLFRKY